MDGELAPRLAQDEAHARVEVEALGGEVELSLGDLPGVDARSDVLGGHRRRNLRVGRPSIGRLVGVGRLPDDPTGRIDRSLDALGRTSDARLMCDAEYSRRSGSGACPMVPVGKVVATVPQPGRLARPPLARSIQDRGADAARPDVRPDRRADQLDRHRVRVEVGDAGQQLARGTPRCPASRVCRIDSRSIGRSMISSMQPLADLRARPDPVDRRHLAVLEHDHRLDRQQRADRGLRRR